jgi:redox-sensing transcriptional repressor
LNKKSRKFLLKITIHAKKEPCAQTKGSFWRITEKNMNNQENTSKVTERQSISPAVIRRLPRYYRYLCELIARGQTRISSSELARLMHVTASQIRQDLNCFGGFGQQGYGYNVNYLFAKISEILGVSAGFKAAIIGAGDLGRALVHLSMFEKRGVDIVALFDTDGEADGKDCAGVPVYPIADLESFCRENGGVYFTQLYH